MTASLRILSSQTDSNTWESFTRSGLKLESGIKAPHTQRLQEKGYQSHFWTRDNVRSVVTWAVEKRTGLLLSGPKSSFQMKVNFAFHWKQGPRVWRKSGEAQIPCCLKSSVKFPQSVMIWLAMSSAGVGPLCFLKSTVNAAIYQEIFRALHASFCWQALWICWFHFPAGLGTCPHAKGTKSWFSDHGVTVLDWPANSPDLNPIENLWGIVKRKMRDTRPNNVDDLKATVETWASIPPQQCHKLITSMPRRIEGSN